jgi:hypothetical protein
MDDDDAQRAAGWIAWLEAVWRLDPAPPSPPRRGTVEALAVSGLPPSAAAVARARFELEVLHDDKARTTPTTRRELKALDALEGLGAWR